MAEATAEQRIFSLILALLTTGDRGVPKHTLLTTVYGYAEQYVWGGSNASLERKFERDKEQLRDLGVPIETYFPYESSGNTQDIHYRIRKELLQIPDSVSFTEPELRMLNAAALMWNDGSLNVEARRALMKLGSLSETISSEPAAVGQVLTIVEPWVKELREAMAQERNVRFSYRKPGKRSSRRHVAPLRLHRADGRWHLIAFDHDRDDYRTFLLSRMTGGVTVEESTYDASLLSAVAQVQDTLTELADSQSATLWVTPGSRADFALSRRGTRDGDHLYITTLDYASLAEELIAYGNEVTIIEPPVLREHLIRIANAMYRDHEPGE